MSQWKYCSLLVYVLVLQISAITTAIRAQIKRSCKCHKIYYESSLLFINCSICFLVITFMIVILFKHSGQLDLNAAQNVQAIYNLNFLHREKRTVFIYNINVG